MKKLSVLKHFGFVVLTIITIVFTVVWSHPSTASSSSSALPGVQIKTPQELNLDYLNESIPRPIADLAGSIIPRARSKVQSSDNIQRAVLIPTTGSVTPAANRSGVSGTPNQVTLINTSTGQTRRVNLRPRQLAVVAARSPSGRVEPITPSNLDTMFAEEERRGGLFNPNVSNLIHGREYLVADASGKYAQANDLLTFNLIAIDTESGNVLEIPEINADSFCVDALNAVLDDTWVNSDFDVNSL